MKTTIIFLFLGINVFGQTDTTNKYCLTPSQRRFIVTQAYQLQECDSLLNSYKIQLNDARNVIKYDGDKLEIMEDKYIMEKTRGDQRLKDLAFVTNELHIKNKKNRLLRIGLFTLPPLSAILSGIVVYKLVK